MSQSHRSGPIVICLRWCPVDLIERSRIATRSKSEMGFGFLQRPPKSTLALKSSWGGNNVLPSSDTKYLADRAVNHSITVESNMTCVLFPGFALPGGLDRTQSDLLLRISAGYPDVPPDMWWFDPPIKRADNQPIPATEVIEHHMGRSWQRWSRHLNNGQWRSSVDGLE